MSMLVYWRAHPPLHILVQGIASGFSGKVVGEVHKENVVESPQKTHVQSADEIFSIMSAAGIPIGVIQQ